MSDTQLVKRIKKRIKELEYDLKIREKSRHYQGWCAESIILPELRKLLEDEK